MTSKVPSRKAAKPPSGAWVRFDAWLLGGLAALLITPAVFACPVCYGTSTPANDGLNSAIIFLLITVGLVQAGFVALFWSFRRRAKALQRQREQFRVLQGGAH
jgi:hypothetical protein